jgi:hypothetical protein
VLLSEWSPGSESRQAVLGRIGEALLRELGVVGPPPAPESPAAAPAPQETTP